MVGTMVYDLSSQPISRLDNPRWICGSSIINYRISSRSGSNISQNLTAIYIYICMIQYMYVHVNDIMYIYIYILCIYIYVYIYIYYVQNIMCKYYSIYIYSLHIYIYIRHLEISPIG